MDRDGALHHKSGTICPVSVNDMCSLELGRMIRNAKVGTERLVLTLLIICSNIVHAQVERNIESINAESNVARILAGEEGYLTRTINVTVYPLTFFMPNDVIKAHVSSSRGQVSLSSIVVFDGERASESRITQMLPQVSNDVEALLTNVGEFDIARIFMPPFGPGTVDESVDFGYDLSANYAFVFTSQQERDVAFEEMQVSGLFAHVERNEIVYNRANFPINDPKYLDNTQWYLRDKSVIPYATNLIKASYLTNVNDNARIGIIEGAEPGTHESLFFSHLDISANVIDSDYLGSSFYSYAFSVAGIASAVTNNARGVAGGSYNAKLGVYAVQTFGDAASAITSYANAPIPYDVFICLSDFPLILLLLTTDLCATLLGMRSAEI